jgi:putative transposase
MELKQLSHAVYICEYHIVLVTKYQREVFNEGVLTHVDKKLAEIMEHYPLIKFEVINHNRDYIYLLELLPPTMSVGEALGIIKQNTSRELKQKFPFLKKV